MCNELLEKELLERCKYLNRKNMELKKENIKLTEENEKLTEEYKKLREGKGEKGAEEDRKGGDGDGKKETWGKNKEEDPFELCDEDYRDFRSDEGSEYSFDDDGE